MAAFGGLGITLILIERYLVTDRRVLTAQEITESLTYTKLLPGSTGVQVVGYLGYRLGGWPGAALATSAFLLPAFLLMLALSIAYEEITAPAVIGLLGITVFTLGRYAFLGWFYGVISGIALVLALFTKASPILILIGGTVLGAVVGPLLTH